MFEKDPDNLIGMTAGGDAALVDDDFVPVGENGETSAPAKSKKRGKSNEPLDDTEPMAASDTASLTPGLVFQRTENHLAYHFVKRTFDIVFSLCVVLVLALPVLALCVVIRLESEGSPIYCQRRVGRWGRPLDIFKLRTMVADSDDVAKHLDPQQLEQWLQERKVGNDPRITRVGSFLRKTSLDELPQFLNVLVGQMSVVGPRPVVEDELAAYGDNLNEFLSVKPGITGWWQVQARNDATYEDGSRQELELFYVRNASLGLDARVFFGTFKAMFGRTGR